MYIGIKRVIQLRVTVRDSGVQKKACTGWRCVHPYNVNHECIIIDDTRRIASAAVAAGATAKAEALIFPSLFPQREGKTFFKGTGELWSVLCSRKTCTNKNIFWSFFEEKVHSKVPSRKKVVF